MAESLLIKNGTVIDGSGSSGVQADVLIQDGTIVRIDRDLVAPGSEVLDARRMAVSPGFIDIHTHDDLGFLIDPVSIHNLQQGVTTAVGGNCGSSPYPITKTAEEHLRASIRELFLGQESVPWRSFGEYAGFLEKRGLGINGAFLVGHGSLRMAVMGYEQRKPTASEMGSMKALLRKCLEQGVFGMSTGLIYPPGVFADTREIAELCKVVRDFGGIYATHMRDEGDHVLDSIEESLTIGDLAKVHVHISHHKVGGYDNWGMSEKTLDLMFQPRPFPVTADAYPYTAGSTSLAALVPPWVHEGGEERLKARLSDSATRAKIREFMVERTDWQNFTKQVSSWDHILVTSVEGHPEFAGKTMRMIAESLKKDPYEALFDTLAEVGSRAGMVIFMMDESDVERILSHPMVAISSDSAGDKGIGPTHPRSYGTFARCLGQLARQKGLFSIEEAVRKMTSYPAKILGLKNKGLLRETFDADIVIFDPQTIIDKATYVSPRETPEGVCTVIVNGQIAYRDGMVTRSNAGKVLLKGKS